MSGLILEQADAASAIGSKYVAQVGSTNNAFPPEGFSP
jgi:hypothetical protein